MSTFISTSYKIMVYCLSRYRDLVCAPSILGLFLLFLLEVLDIFSEEKGSV